MELHYIQGAARLLFNLAPSALRWWEKGGVGIIRKVSFLPGLVTAIRWLKEEQAFAEGGYFSIGRSIIATQRAFRTRFNIRTEAPLPGRQSIALWVNTFRVSGNVEKNTRDLQRAPEHSKTLRRRGSRLCVRPDFLLANMQLPWGFRAALWDESFTKNFAFIHTKWQ